mmetsp:Transcript_840/g.716  ORF Transcript_840/g.716 Transcript_840/m.716 type:complete len:83 (-) Transcript_840:30-278(-)
MVRGWEGWMKDSMHKLDAPEPGTLAGDNHVVIHDGNEYGTYVDGFHVMAEKVWQDVQEYEGGVGFVNDVSSKHLHNRIPNLH